MKALLPLVFAIGIACSAAQSTARDLAALVADTHDSSVHAERFAGPNSTLFSFRRSHARTADAPRVLIVCGVHGRERITFDVCAHWTRMLAALEQATVLDIMLVPLLNPLGMALAERDPCWRGNAAGVDLNRNHVLLPHFAPDAIDEQALQSQLPHTHTTQRRRIKESVLGEETYAGPAPASEPETRALISLMERFKPDIVLSVHSGTRAVLVPFDSMPDIRPPNERELLQFAHWLKAGVCDECAVGRGAQMLYPATGTIVDYAYWYGTADIAMTLEIYGESIDHRGTAALTPESCRCVFNPCDARTHAATLERWAPLLTLLADMPEDDLHTIRAMIRNKLPA